MAIPNVPVFHSEHNGTKLDIFADQNGLRINLNNQDLAIYPWIDWLLTQAMKDSTNDYFGFWNALLSAIPPPPDE